MEKYAIWVLSICLVVLGAYTLWQRHQSSQDRLTLSNQLASYRQNIREGEHLYSSQSIVLQDAQKELLAAIDSKKELSKSLKQKEEKILSLTKINLSLASKTFDIPEAKQSEIEERTRVDFAKQDDLVKVSGYTLTNPPFANIKLEYLRDLSLSVIVTKNKDGVATAYVDSPDTIPVKIDFRIDQSVDLQPWYTKLQLIGGVAAGNTGLLSTVGIGYQFNKLSVGLAVHAGLPNLSTHAGVIVQYNLFAR